MAGLVPVSNCGDTGCVGGTYEESAMFNTNSSTMLASSTGGLGSEPGRTKKALGRKHEDLQQKYASSGPSAQDITTLMLRHVPRNYTEDALISEIEAYLSPEQYDFLYLPWDSRRSSNCGYAFVNCVDMPTATKFEHQINGKSWRLIKSQKDIKCVPAHVQGLALNLAHYMGSSVVEEGYEHSPMIFSGGKRIDFQFALDSFCPPELVEKHREESARQAEDLRNLQSSDPSEFLGSNASTMLQSLSGFHEGSFGGVTSNGYPASLAFDGLGQTPCSRQSLSTMPQHNLNGTTQHVLAVPQPPLRQATFPQSPTRQRLFPLQDLPVAQERQQMLPRSGAPFSPAPGQPEQPPAPWACQPLPAGGPLGLQQQQQQHLPGAIPTSPSSWEAACGEQADRLLRRRDSPHAHGAQHLSPVHEQRQPTPTWQHATPQFFAPSDSPCASADHGPGRLEPPTAPGRVVPFGQPASKGQTGITLNHAAKDLMRTEAYGKAWSRLNKQLEDLARMGLSTPVRSL